jgi:alpha-N-arabinofuranosidase
MANIAQTVNVLQAMMLTEGPKMILTPTYHAFEMFKVHQDTTHLPVEVETPVYEFAVVEIPALSVSASKADDGVVYVSLVNTHARDSISVNCELEGIDASKVSGRVLTADKLDAHNTFDNPEVVKPAEFKDCSISDGKLKVNMPPHSVVVLSLVK